MRLGHLNAVVISAVLLTICQIPTSDAVRRGYSLGFQLHSIAGPKNGWIDFSDPGFNTLDRNFTVAFWMQFYKTGYPFGITSDADVNHFNPVWYTYGLVFGQEWSIRTDVYDWFHVTVVADDVNGLALYINGLESTRLAPDPSFVLKKSDLMSLHFGDHLYTFHDQVVSVGDNNGFMGEMDEFGLWSRALSDSEISNLVTGSMTRDEVRADSSILLYYDMEINCDHADQVAHGISEAATSCSVVGGDKTLPNIGSAGSSYDLMMGRLNNDFGNGEGYVISGSAPGTPIHPWAYPLPAKSVPSTAFEMERLDVPSVFYALAGGPRVKVEINSSATFVIEELPTTGTLYRTVNSTIPIIKGDTLTSAAELYYEATSNSAAFQNPDWFSFNATSHGNENHQVHVWPYLPPKLSPRDAIDNHQITVAEDSAGFQHLYTLATYYSRPPGPFGAVLSQLPTKCEWYFYTQTGYLVNTAINQTSDGMYVGGGTYLIPFSNLYGTNFDSFGFKAYDMRSGLTGSEEVVISVNVLEDNDKVQTEDGVRTVAEDSNGIVMKLNATDFEVNSVGIMITKLPEKGDLYRVNPDNTKEKIDAVYEQYKFVNIVDQYAYEIVKVSTFWGSPPNNKYHPMGMLGRPNCFDSYGECAIDDRENGGYIVDDIVRLDYVFYDATAPAIPVVGTVIAVHVQEDGSKLYDVQVMPMLKYTSEYVNCYMLGTSFPSQCSEEEYATKGATNILAGVPITSFYISESMVWGPQNPSYTEGLVQDGGTASAAFGRQYEFRAHDGSSFYKNNDPPYDEYIEFKIKDPGYIVDLEVGEPRGGGAITRVKVMNPDGNWDIIYQDDPLHREHAKTTNVGLYHWFTQRVCRPFYPVQHFRLELDTSSTTGISEYNYIDYVKVSTAMEAQSAALIYPVQKIQYVPHKDEEGMDSFEFTATDCGGDRLRNAPPAKVEVNIIPIADAPNTQFTLVEAPPQTNIAELSTGELKLTIPAASSVVLRLDGIEVDVGDVVTFAIDALPSENVATTKLLTNYPSSRDETALRIGTLSQNYETNNKRRSVYLLITSSKCKEIDPVQSPLTFTASDTQQASATKTITVVLDCSGLVRQYAFEGVSSTDQAFSKVMGVIGMVVSVLAALFNMRYRMVPVVRMTSPRINLIICFGSGLVFLYLFLSGNSMARISECAVEDYVSTLTCADDPCCTKAIVNRCILPVVFASLGTIMVFATLIGKTERIVRLLMSKDLRKRKISDRMVVTQAAGAMLPVLLVLLVWMATDPPLIVFEISNPELNAELQSLDYTLSPVCSSDTSGTFEAMLIGYIGMAVLYGAVQAYKVRNVHIKQANDSTSIAIAVYNIFMFGSLALAMQYTVKDVGPKHILTSILIFLSGIITILALFGVRAYEIFTGVTKIHVTSTNGPETRGAGTSLNTTHEGGNTMNLSTSEEKF